MVKYVSFNINEGDEEAIAEWFFALNNDPKTASLQLQIQETELEGWITHLDRLLGQGVWELSSLQLLVEQDPTIIFRISGVRSIMDGCKLLMQEGEGPLQRQLCALGGGLALLMGKIREMEAALEGIEPRFE